MHSYADFCVHYGLDPCSQDARDQYQEYQTNASILESLPAKNHGPAIYISKTPVARERREIYNATIPKNTMVRVTRSRLDDLSGNSWTEVLSLQEAIEHGSHGRDQCTMQLEVELANPSAFAAEHGVTLDDKGVYRDENGYHVVRIVNTKLAGSLGASKSSKS